MCLCLTLRCFPSCLYIKKVSFGNDCDKDIKLYLNATWHEVSWRQNTKSCCLQGTINLILVIAGFFLDISKFIKGIVHWILEADLSISLPFVLFAAAADARWPRTERMCFAYVQGSNLTCENEWACDLFMWFWKLEQWVSGRITWRCAIKIQINHGIST